MVYIESAEAKKELGRIDDILYENNRIKRRIKRI